MFLRNIERIRLIYFPAEVLTVACNIDSLLIFEIFFYCDFDTSILQCLERGHSRCVLYHFCVR